MYAKSLKNYKVSTGEIPLPHPISVEELRQGAKEIDIDADLSANKEMVPELKFVESDQLTPKVAEAIAVLRQNQNQIPVDVRMHIIEDILRDEYSKGVCQYKSDIELTRRHHPIAYKVFWQILDAVSMAEGIRFIPDRAIRERVNSEANRRRDPFWKRWLKDKFLSDQQKNDEILSEAIQLASDNEGLKKENADLRAQNDNLAKQNKETLESMAIEARKIIEAANTEARNLISATRDSLFQENKRVKELQIIAEELAKNPEIKNVYAKKQETRFDILAEQIFIQGQRFIGSSRKFEREEDFLRALSSMSNHLRSFDKNILGVLEDIEIQFGLEKRNLVVYRLRQKLTGTIQADFLIQYFSGYFPQGMYVKKNYQSARIREFTFSNSFLKILDMLTANHPLATVRLQLHALIKYLDTEVPAQAENLIIDKEVYRYPFRANSDDSLYIRQKAEARHTVIEKITSLLNDITEATKTP